MQKRIECTISGRVQLVMFRDFAERKASKLGLLGRVRNERDGTVHIIAEGEKSDLEEFVSLLRRGSFLSRVDSVTVSWGSAQGNFRRFVIVH